MYRKTGRRICFSSGSPGLEYYYEATAAICFGVTGNSVPNRSKLEPDFWPELSTVPVPCLIAKAGVISAVSASHNGIAVDATELTDPATRAPSKHTSCLRS